MAGLNFDPFGGNDPFASIGHIPGISNSGSAGQPRQRAFYRRPLAPEESQSLAGQALNTGASGLSYILGTLDKPGQAVRGVLAGKGAGAIKHLIPFSDTLGITTDADQTSGRDLTNKWGITDRRDNDWGSWGLGLAADIATDPLTYATFGAKSALTPVGKALQKGGHLKGWSREALLSGYNALKPELEAAGQTASQIAHAVDKGARIASPEAIAAASTAGGLKANQPLSGLARLSVPFGGPGVTIGTGKIGLKVAQKLDRAADYLQFGNPIGRTLGAWFDPSRHEAVDALTQRGARKYLDPALAELNQQGRDQAYGVLSQLDPLIKQGTFSEPEVTEAARAAAEGTPFVGMANPTLQPHVQQVGNDIADLGRSWIAQAREAGAPLSHVDDPYANYVHRQALDVNHANLQLGAPRTRGNLYPVASGANMHRDELLRGIPGGTARINDWYRRFAATPDVAVAAKAIKKDLALDLMASGQKITKTLGKEFDAKAAGLAERLAGASDRYLPSAEFPEGLGLFTPNLAADTIQRTAQHARTVAAAKGAIGTIGDAAQNIGSRSDLVPVADVLKKLGLKTYMTGHAPGTTIEGALVQAYRALAKKGAGSIDQFLAHRTQTLANGATEVVPPSMKRLRKAVNQYGITPEAFEQITKAHQKWAAPEVIKSPLGALDSVTNTFKALAYPIWIPSHVRNAFTAGINNLRSGTRLGDYLDQLKVMTGRGTRDLSGIHPSLAGLTPEAQIDAIRRQQFATGNIYGGHGFNDDIAENAMEALANSASGIGPGRFTPGVPGADRIGTHGNLAADAADLVLKQGLLSSLGSTAEAAKNVFSDPLAFSPRNWGSGRISSALAPLGIKGVGGATKDALPAVQAGRIAGGNIEDFFRGAQWLREVRNGATPEQAAQAVNKVHFDYDRLTQTEKKVMRRLMPFYTFARKNLPLQAETALTRPGILQAQYKPFNQEEPGETGYVPKYLASGVAIPTGPEQNGSRQYISKLGLPLEEAFERMHFKNGLPDVGSTMLDYMGQLNPVIKAPLEQLFDTQFHTQRRLSDLKTTGSAGTIGRMFGDENPQLLGQIMSNSPFTRFFTAADKLADDRKGMPAKLANLLTGVRVTDVDVNKQRAIDLRNSLEAILREHPHISKHLDFYVKPEDAQNLSPEEVQLMRLYSGIQDAAKRYGEEKRKRIGVKK